MGMAPTSTHWQRQGVARRKMLARRAVPDTAGGVTDSSSTSPLPLRRLISRRIVSRYDQRATAAFGWVTTINNQRDGSAPFDLFCVNMRF